MAENDYIWIEFLQNYGCCNSKGDVKRVKAERATLLIGKGIAKMAYRPPKDKMVRWANNKGLGSHYIG